MVLPVLSGVSALLGVQLSSGRICIWRAWHRASSGASPSSPPSISSSSFSPSSPSPPTSHFFLRKRRKRKRYGSNFIPLYLDIQFSHHYIWKCCVDFCQVSNGYNNYIHLRLGLLFLSMWRRTLQCCHINVNIIWYAIQHCCFCAGVCRPSWVFHVNFRIIFGRGGFYFHKGCHGQVHRDYTESVIYFDVNGHFHNDPAADPQAWESFPFSNVLNFFLLSFGVFIVGVFDFLELNQKSLNSNKALKLWFITDYNAWPELTINQSTSSPQANTLITPPDLNKEIQRVMLVSGKGFTVGCRSPPNPLRMVTSVSAS